MLRPEPVKQEEKNMKVLCMILVWAKIFLDLIPRVEATKEKSANVMKPKSLHRKGNSQQG
jgi:hypothetical protein